MKHRSTITAAAVLSIAIVTACGDESKANAAPASNGSASKSLQSQATDALDSTKASFDKLKQDYQKTLDARLAQAAPYVQKLKDEAAQATGDAKSELERLVKKLEGKRKFVEEQLAGWKQDGTESWQALTADLDRIVKEIETTAQNALAARSDDEPSDEEK